jgi:Protein of unknown function DUF262
MGNDSLIISDRLSDEELNNLYERGNRRSITEISRPTLLKISELSVENHKIGFSSASYRQSISWTLIQKSRLIESFLLNIPVVPVVLSELNVKTYEIIDGEQRILAIVDFFNNNFQLKGMESWGELNGMNYQELPWIIRNSLNKKHLQTTTILFNPDAAFDPEVIKHTTYERLNSWRLT